MKAKFIFINVIVALLFVSCSSSMKYGDDAFDTTYFQKKTIYFKLTEDSKYIKIVKSGPYAGETHTPDNEKTFKKSILKLADKTHLNLKYAQGDVTLSDNDVFVTVNIIEINWLFTASSATMKSSITYQLKDKNKSFDIIGSTKNLFGGSKETNLYKSLINANYLFLKELEKN